MKLLSSLLSAALGDIYLHFPRGSNNRLNEHTENRANANRLFDSENNNQGGYNVGDKTDLEAEDMSGQSKAVYFQSGSSPSELTLEWTNQHGCGRKGANDANWVDCAYTIQYMCQVKTLAYLPPLQISSLPVPVASKTASTLKPPPTPLLQTWAWNPSKHISTEWSTMPSDQQTRASTSPGTTTTTATNESEIEASSLPIKIETETEEPHELDKTPLEINMATSARKSEITIPTGTLHHGWTLPI